MVDLQELLGRELDNDILEMACFNNELRVAIMHMQDEGEMEMLEKLRAKQMQVSEWLWEIDPVHPIGAKP